MLTYLGMRMLIYWIPAKRKGFRKPDGGGK